MKTISNSNIEYATTSQFHVLNDQVRDLGTILKDQENVILKNKNDSCANLLLIEEKLLKVFEDQINSNSFYNQQYNEKFEQLNLKCNNLSDDLFYSKEEINKLHKIIDNIKNDKIKVENANQIRIEIEKKFEKKFEDYLKREEYNINYFTILAKIDNQLKEKDNVK